MPDTPPPSAQPDSSAEPTEFNFDKPASGAPRIKRRSLKTKASGLQPSNPPPASARELEREAPPLSQTEAARHDPIPDAKATSQVRMEPVPKSTPTAPPRTTPATSATVNGSAAPAAQKLDPATENPASASGQKVNVNLTAPQKASVSSLSASPHGTRPATLYYSTQSKKETSPAMKPTTNASPSAASSTSSSSSASAASATRPAATTSAAPSSATRPAATTSNPMARPSTVNVDYRANVERQSREQKSVGNILSYFVYGLLALFLLSAALATYGAVIIFDKLHDQSTSLADIDARYGTKVSDLNKQLATAQDALTQAQAQLTRQQDLLGKQDEEINQLRTAINAASAASAEAIHAEAKARTQESAALRARIRDLEYKSGSTQNFTRP